MLASLRRFGALGALVCALVQTGCGAPPQESCLAKDEADELAPSLSAPLQERLLPLVVGATWSYRGASETVDIEVEALEAVPDRPEIKAFRVAAHHSLTDQSIVEWQQDLGHAVVLRHRRWYDAEGANFGDERFIPYRFLVDERSKHRKSGATWDMDLTDRVSDSEAWSSTCKTDNWKLIAAEVVTEVPAGKFHCVEFEREGKLYWFSKGVGKVRQETRGDPSKLLELVTYKIPK